jgi:hypothetical protein
MKITLGSVLSYFVGIGVILLSILLTIQSPVGLVPLVAGVLILPPVRRYLESERGIELSRGITVAIGFVAIVAVMIGIVAVAGGGDSGTSEELPGSDVSDVSVTAIDSAESGASSELEIEWNARAQSAVDPDPDDLSIYNSNEGQKYVVVRMNIQNDGSEPVELTPGAFSLRSDGVEYDYQGLFGSGNSISQVTLNPEGEYSGWVAFSVPQDMTNAELITNQDAYFDQTVSTRFESNSDMEINMSD